MLILIILFVIILILSVLFICCKFLSINKDISKYEEDEDFKEFKNKINKNL